MDQLHEQVMHVTKALERQVDAAIENIESLDIHDIENLRKQRLQELKTKELKMQGWLSNGHGKYEELAEEKEFFVIIKKSENVVVHFYTNTNARCRIVDMHLKKLAPKHIETLFVSLNAEKCPFLAEKLKIKVIPTLVCIQNGIMVDKIVGFTTLGNKDDFTSETLEWRIAQNAVIEYEGDLTTPPDEQTKKVQNSGKTIRDGCFNGDDDDTDLGDYTTIIGNGNSNGTAEKNLYELTPEEEAELGLND